MAFSKTLIPLLPLFLLLQLLVNKVVPQGDTTDFAYNSFTSASKNLIYQGDAFVPSASSFARLTKANAVGKPSTFSVGRVLYSPPIKFWEPGRQLSFTSTMKFTITPVDHHPADGLTFFIIPVGSPIPSPSTGGSFGLFNLYTGKAPSVFAVEFDIFHGSDNAKWDPPYRHIGIDINSRVSKAVSKFENDALGREVTARVSYSSAVRTISVLATYGSKNSTLTYTYDLKTVLSKRVQVGISGATGGSVALHDLRAWYFTSALVWDGYIDAVNNTYIK